MKTKGGHAVAPKRSGEAVINQQGEDLPKEGPSHLGSSAAAFGGIRASKRRRQTLFKEGRKSAVRSIKRNLPRRHCRPGNRSKEEPSPDRQGEGHGSAKRLDEQRPRTSRRRGSGMWTRLITELERPSRAHWRRAASGRRTHIKPSAKLRFCSTGVGWGHSTNDGLQENAAGGKDPCFVPAPHADTRW